MFAYASPCCLEGPSHCPTALCVPLAQKLEVLVLDEADSLLDMGFSRTLSEILTQIPKQAGAGGMGSRVGAVVCLSVST